MRPMILVVDDCASLRTMLRMALEHAGYEVLEAGDGRAALEAARRHFPDLVLLDLRMPGLDGRQTVRALTRDVRTGSIPVVAMGGEHGAESEELLAVGFCGFLPKPFQMADLLGLVRRCLGRVESTHRAGERLNGSEAALQAA